MHIARDLLKLTGSLFWAAGIVILFLIIGFGVLAFLRRQFPGVLGHLATGVEHAADQR